MNQKSLYAVGYMFVVTAFFSALIIGFARGTKDRVEANERLAFEKAVLSAFPEIPYTADGQAHQFFQEHFELRPEAAGAWVYVQNGETAGYALPIEGKGFWATIRGIVGIASDGRTIRGLAFYEQNETPGLGARIAEPFFRDQFQGLAMGQDGPPVELRPAGSALSAGQVHAISGATQTCMRLETLLNEDVQDWLKKMSEKGTQP
jgi:Na+-transporting NADH:ubiquinone oxidoreductase subunit C